MGRFIYIYSRLEQSDNRSTYTYTVYIKHYIYEQTFKTEVTLIATSWNNSEHFKNKSNVKNVSVVVCDD